MANKQRTRRLDVFHVNSSPPYPLRPISAPTEFIFYVSPRHGLIPVTVSVNMPPPPPAPERFAPAVLLSPPPRWSVALYSWPHFAPHFTRHPCANEGRGWLSWSRCVAPPGLRRPMGVRVLASFLPQQPKNQARLRRPGCHVYSACYGPSPYNQSGSKIMEIGISVAFFPRWVRIPARSEAPKFFWKMLSDSPTLGIPWTEWIRVGGWVGGPPPHLGRLWLFGAWPTEEHTNQPPKVSSPALSVGQGHKL